MLVAAFLTLGMAAGTALAADSDTTVAQPHARQSVPHR